MYPSTSLFIACGQLAIVVLVMFSYPLQVHPCRNCLDKVFCLGQSDTAKVPSSADDEQEDEETDLDHADTDISALRHALLTSIIVVGGFTIAYMVDDLEMGK